MSGFGDEMQAQLEAFRNANPAETKKKTGRAVTEYTCEVSGIDMVVSRIVNGRCTMKMFVYLSQPNDKGEGTILIKSLREGVIKEGDEDSIAVFLKDLKEEGIVTGSNAIPILRGGKKFARRLDEFRCAQYLNMIKEGLLNSEMLNDEEYDAPWYLSRDSYHTTGYGVKDRHAKLMRHAVTALSERHGIKYWEALARSCKRYRYYYTPKSDGKYSSIWAFSMLADVYDEPYAMKCFDEYLDNERLDGLYCSGIRDLFDTVVKRTSYTTDWASTVGDIRNNSTYTTLEKNRLWTYLQESIRLGLGKNLSGFINQYCDYLKQSRYCDGKVKDKYPEYLQVAHDVYSEKYKLIAEFKEAEELKNTSDKGKAVANQVHDGYQLKVLGTVNEFLEEARQNCNCVASYVDKARRGRCWIASFRPVDAEETLLTVEIDPSSGRMVQIKGKCNRDATMEESKRLEIFQDTILKNMGKA